MLGSEAVEEPSAVGDCISTMSGTEAEKAALRADGWRFSGDPTAPSGPAERQGAWVAENAVESAADIATRLKAAVCQNGQLAADSVLEAMAGDDRAEVQAGGCSALAILCESQAGRRCAQGKDALAAVLRALAAHPEAPAVQASGCAAIANLVLEEGEAAVLAAGAIGAVIKALAAHPDAVTVQAKGCLALGNIAGGDAGEAEAVRCGAVAAAFDALRFCNDAKVAEEAVDALSNLTANPPGLAALAATDAPRDMLERVAAAHGLADATALAGRLEKIGA